jgi:hypothetical protein
MTRPGSCRKHQGVEKLEPQPVALSDDVVQQNKIAARVRHDHFAFTGNERSVWSRQPRASIFAGNVPRGLSKRENRSRAAIAVKRERRD